MSWLARLKTLESAPAPTLQNLQKADAGAFVGFVGAVPTPFQNSSGDGAAPSGSDADAANDALPGQYVRTRRASTSRVSGVHKDAVRVREGQALDVAALNVADGLAARLALFTDRGLSLEDAEAVAARLAIRDRQLDERRLCLECAHLSGGAGGWRCSQWRQHQHNGPEIPADLVTAILHRCGAFNDRGR